MAHKSSHVVFSTSDGGTKVGQRIKSNTGVTEGSMMYYTYSTGAWAKVERNKRPDYVHSRLLAERDLEIEETQLGVFVQSLAFELLQITTDDELSISTRSFLEALISLISVRHEFYDLSTRPGLLDKYAVSGDDYKNLLAVETEFAQTALAANDLAFGEHDNQLYVLFEPEEDGLPNSEWLAAARDYVKAFKANLGFYTSAAMSYARVLVVAHDPLSAPMQRAVQFLKALGADARPLTANNTDELHQKLDQLIDSQQPLPGESPAPDDHSQDNIRLTAS